MNIVPISLAEANAFVEEHHRHHAPVAGHKFSVAVADVGFWLIKTRAPAVRGVAIIGRPVARGNDDGLTLEVNRCCTDGTRNACSMLYAAAWRAARAMGYLRLITYTLPAEGGASLRGAGWRLVGERGGGNWNTPARPRVDTDQLLRGQKLLWEAA
ncbi:XF1762 family protein [Paraburkholderia caribensis]|uniref:XF1762 family protein n=1 Tax=Paraburkholderia caribensis TaxID=75105 RepID=UPI001D074D07|nr:XF1762 family protein [Paraburkholderia caribensis]